jgi:hypothetical protein
MLLPDGTAHQSSSSSPSSSPSLLPLVSLSSHLPSPLSSFHPPSTPRAVAHKAGGGWCVVLWLALVSSVLWGSVLGGVSYPSSPNCRPPVIIAVPPLSTPRAGARKAGGGWSSWQHCLLLPGVVVVNPPTIHPPSSFSWGWERVVCCLLLWVVVVGPWCLFSSVFRGFGGGQHDVARLLGWYPSSGVSRHPSSPSCPSSTPSHPVKMGRRGFVQPCVVPHCRLSLPVD